MNDKKYSIINLFLRSLVFTITSTLLIIIYSMLVVIICPFLSMPNRHKFIRGFCYSYTYLVKVICHIDYIIEGLENIPKDHVCIVMAKHQSVWETFFIATFLYSPAIILKRELLFVPFFGWALAVGGVISINRRNKTNAMQQVIAQGEVAIKQGRWILVFPEGTRTKIGEKTKYHLGGARLAVATHTNILPIAHNSGRYWAKRQFIKIPGTIHVVIGPEIQTEGRTPEDVLAQTKDWIESTVARVDSLVDKSTR